MLFICLLCFCSFSFGLVELDQVNVVGGVPYQPDCSLMLIQASVSLTSGVRGVLGGACMVFAPWCLLPPSVPASHHPGVLHLVQHLLGSIELLPI